MPKPKNVTPTQQITIATTPQVVKILTRLAQQGLHGKNIAEVAERLLSERLREFVEQKKIASEELGNS
ncbi:MAG: hypothetical protein ACLP9L_24760 [Thermoguttaceae bacterium]